MLYKWGSEGKKKRKGKKKVQARLIRESWEGLGGRTANQWLKEQGENKRLEGGEER